MSCKHVRTRCIHAEEANRRRFRVRFWRYPRTYRQMCLDCNVPLDREAICDRIRPNLHLWTGSWDQLR